MQPDSNVDVMSLVKTLAVLAVFGAIAAKLTLDWAQGKRSSLMSSEGSDGGSDEGTRMHHDGGGSDHDGGGDTDGGHA